QPGVCRDDTEHAGPHRTVHQCPGRPHRDKHDPGVRRHVDQLAGEVEPVVSGTTGAEHDHGRVGPPYLVDGGRRVGDRADHVETPDQFEHVDHGVEEQLVLLDDHDANG